MIERAFRKGKPTAVALVINSPGGSPVQAGIINDEIRRLKALHKKPVYVVVEETCASAAYYIAAAADKIYMGYSDAGNVLGALYRAGIGRLCHGPMPADIRRAGGEAAVTRALDWIVHQSPHALEPHVRAGEKHAALNLMTLAMMVGTPLMPDLFDHVLMVEEVSEYLYGYDRAFFHVTSHLRSVGLTGLRLGRVSDVPDNDRPFGEGAEEIAQRWCAKTGINYFGRADIGHDADNRIVPFGLATSSAAP